MHIAREKKSCFELSAHVPLVIRAPWITSAVGVKTNSLTELVDVYPTLASLAVSSDATV